MARIAFKATTTTTDAGVFSAVISTASVDREGDIVDPAAMVDALKAWAAAGKMVPLVWQHDAHDPEETIGTVDPTTARAVGEEVHVDGHVDQSTPRGEQAWRLVKSGALGFSFGYLIPKGGATKNAHGGLNITALDVFEITATLTPMNQDTRVTGWKSVDAAVIPALLDAVADPGNLPKALDLIGASELSEQIKEDLATRGKEILDAHTKSVDATDSPVDPLRRRAEQTALELATGGADLSHIRAPEPAAKAEPQYTADELRRLTRDATLSVLTGDNK